MKIKKLVLFLVLPLVLAACGGGNPTTSEDTTSEEVTSIEPTSVDVTSEDASEEDSSGPVAPDKGIVIHYKRNDNNYENWNLWIWEASYEGSRYDFNGTDDWGVSFTADLSEWVNPLENSIGFIVRRSDTGNDWASREQSTKQDGNRFFDFTIYDKDALGYYHLYILSGDINDYIDDQMHQKGIITKAEFINNANADVLLQLSAAGSIGIDSYSVKTDGQTIQSYSYKDMAKKPTTISWKSKTIPVEFDKDYYLNVTFENGDVREQLISKSNLYSTDRFNNLYQYDGELGALYSEEHTTFKVWSPFSSSIVLRIYDTGTPEALGGTDTPILSSNMVKGEKGVYEATIDGDLDGKYYTYFVTNSTYPNGKEVVDPYARSAGINGVRGMVVNPAKTNPDGWDEVDYLPYDRKELVVYETHVADVTSSETWNGTPENAKKFKGMIEKGTRYNGVTTGFDHIVELGVNAVQILPFFDQANDEVNVEFNWGYNPLNYNVVEGCYSSNAYDGYARIRELKELVQAFNKEGIEIIMDVVYNHVAGAVGNNLDVLVPGYYYRYDTKGGLSNGSGCGNETASENAMFRKFMIDSINYWLSEFKLGGFRFDLMGLHDVTTMNQLVASAKEINPHVCIYGEPWTGGTTPLPSGERADQANATKFVGFGQFNDQMRNALHGGVFTDTDLGWANSRGSVSSEHIASIKYGLLGKTNSRVVDPDWTTNYVTCHDNLTLFDRMVATKQYDAEIDYDAILGMCTAAHGLVFLSQGTSFMLAGEEFARTKGGDHNSYCSSYKVNELDYALKAKNIDMFNAFKVMIKEKVSNPLLHLTKEEIAAKASTPAFSNSNSVVSYTVTDTSAGHSFKMVSCNNNASGATVNLSGYASLYSTKVGTNFPAEVSEYQLSAGEVIIANN